MSAGRFPGFGLPLFAILVALDQISKVWIARAVGYHEGIPIIGQFFIITYVRNPGGAFSTRLGGSLFYIIIAAVAAVMVVLYLLFSKNRSVSLQLSLFAILSGAIGNLIDRVRIGEVIDWIDIGIGELRWPTFNIADSAIVIGLLILIFTSSGDERKNRNNKCSGKNSPDEAGCLSCGDGPRPEPEPDTEAYSE